MKNTRETVEAEIDAVCSAYGAFINAFDVLHKNTLERMRNDPKLPDVLRDLGAVCPRTLPVFLTEAYKAERVLKKTLGNH